MIYEFEGRTEKEAVDKAAAELGMEKDQFDVEILESQRSGLFKKGFVKIQVHTDVSGSGRLSSDASGDSRKNEGAKTGNGRNGRAASQNRSAMQSRSALHSRSDMQSRSALHSRSAQQSGTSQQIRTGLQGTPDDFEEAMVSFMETIIELMGYAGKVTVLYREESKLGLKIESDYSSILIGKKGKNLDALQLLANIYAGRLGREDMRIILDSENYRLRREESLVRLAYTVADRVRENRTSILLEPMNPFDRRLIHTTLNDISDIETKSEGDGLFKQVRVLYRGYR